MIRSMHLVYREMAKTKENNEMEEKTETIGKAEMIGKIRNIFTLLDKYQDLGNFMPKEDKQRIRDDLACFMDFLAGKYLIPKEDLTITQVNDNHYRIGNQETRSVKYTLSGVKKKYVMNPNDPIRFEDFWEFTKEDFKKELDYKYKI